jgi:hypothetical protein
VGTGERPPNPQRHSRPQKETIPIFNKLSFTDDEIRQPDALLHVDRRLYLVAWELRRPQILI